MASSNENVGTVQPTVTIPAGKVQATATFSTTYRAGTTTITAAGTDLTADTETLTTIGPIPTRIAVHCTPPTLPADNKAYNTIQVQLQDSGGKPALDPDGEVTVTLLSSDPAVAIVNETLTIPYGQTYATTEFTTTYLAEKATFTAQASGYTKGQAEVATYIVDHTPLQVAVTANPSIIASSGQTNITTQVTYPGGSPTAGANVKLTSNSSGAFTGVEELGNGFYRATFTAPKSNTQIKVDITATASKTDYTTTSVTIQVTVGSTEELGTIDLCLIDENGEPVNDALVQTLSQPIDMAQLVAMTNSTGHVSFSGVSQGAYLFNITKQGYNPITQIIDFTVTMPVQKLVITKEGDNSTGLNPTLIWLILIAVVVIVVIIIAAYIQKRKTTGKFKVPKTWAPPEPPKLRSRRIEFGNPATKAKMQ